MATRRRSTGQPVGFNEAMAAWVPAARDLLVKVAGEYGKFLTYGQLTDAVQDETDIETGMLIYNWVGPLLFEVERLAKEGEPTLTSLVVRANETVGSGYGDCIERREGARPASLDDHAAAERLACNRYFGADVPQDAEPKLPPKVIEARARPQRTTAPVRRPQSMCCFTQVTSDGRCSSCGDSVV